MAWGLHIIWSEIFDDFVERYQMGGEAINVLILQMSLYKRRLKFIAENDKKQLTFMQIEQRQIDAMTSKVKQEQIDFYENKARMESILKYQIDTRTTSVREYQAYVEMIKRDHKKNGR